MNATKPLTTKPATQPASKPTDAKRQAAVSASFDDAMTTLTLKFANGKELRVVTHTLSPMIARRALIHGLSAKLVDAAALPFDKELNRFPTIDEKFDAVKEVFDRITAPEGEWNAIREGSGETGGVLARALVRLHGGKKTIEEVREWLATKTAEEKTALRGNAKVAAIISAMAAEKPEVKKVDTDALLDELK